MLSLLRRVSLRHLARHPLRSALTVAGVALGVAAVVAIGAVNESVLRGLRRATAEFAGRAELVVSGDRAGVPAGLLERIREVPGVRYATPIVRQPAAVKAIDGRPAHGMIQVVGVDILDERMIADASFRREDLQIRDPILLLERPRSLVVTRSFARRHGLEGRFDQARLALATSIGVQELTVRGAVQARELERLFGGNIAFMDVESAAKVFGKVGRFDEINVHVASEAERDTVRDHLRSLVGTGFEVERPNDRGRQSERVLSTWQAGLSLISILTLLVGSLLVYQTLSVSVRERRGEIGILRALGASRARVAALFAAEAIFVGALGAALGVAAGLGAARGLLRAMSELLSTYIVYADLHELHGSLRIALVGGAAGVLAALLAGIGPALRAARLLPVDAMRPSTREPLRRRSAVVLAACGVLLLGVGGAGAWYAARGTSAVLAQAIVAALFGGALLLLPALAPLLLSRLAAVARRIPGLPARLAAGNLTRMPEGATVTLGAMLSGIALVLSSGTLAESFKAATAAYIDRSIPADLLVTGSTELYTPSSMPMTQAIADRIRGFPAVEEVIAVRWIDARVRGERVDLLSIDASAWSRRAGFTLKRGDPERLVADLGSGRGVAVSENLATTFGYRVGETIEVRTPRGPASFPILAVFVDYASAFGVVALDRAIFRRYWDDDLADLYQVYLRPGNDPYAVRDELARAFERTDDLFFLTNAQAKARIRKMIDDAYAIVRVQELIALGVALFGLANTLLLSVMNRGRELGIVRALGATRRQVALAVVVESVLIALAGAVLGLGLGAALSVVNVEVLSVVQTGWRVEYQFAGATAAKLVAALLAVAVIAAWLPARRAARTPVAQAVAYE